ncbi:MAG: hypothetical protein R6V17_02590, partial [Halanaerobacter sp.]
FALGVGATLLALRYMPELDIERMGTDIQEKAEAMKEKMAKMDLDTTAEEDYRRDNQDFQTPDDVAVIGSSPTKEDLQSALERLQGQLNHLKNNM